jgi:hypothetical protein
MRIETPPKARELHQPEQSAAGRTVFAFDRDDTVDVNPPPMDDHEAVPLAWIAHLAHRTEHIVYATGNQLLKREATIPGTTEILAAHPAYEWPNSDSSNQQYLSRQEQVQLLGELYDDADQHIVVDDEDLSKLDDWTHYYSWDFVPEARNSNIVSDLPPAEPLDELDEFLDPQIPGEF